MTNDAEYCWRQSREFEDAANEAHRRGRYQRAWEYRATADSYRRRAEDIEAAAGEQYNDPFEVTDGPAPPMTEQDRENMRWLAREARRINYGW